MGKKQVKTAKKQLKKVPKQLREHAFEKGESGNPNGRPKGQKNYSTIYWEALEKLAEANDKTAEEIHIEIIQKGILQARKGDYKFYRDVLDREYGRAQERIDHTTKGKELPRPILGGISNEVQEHNSHEENSESQEED